jgi:DNA ligase-1
MLASSKIPALSELKYPVVASPKLDGIRCLIIDGEAVSRNLKPIPNQYVRECLAKLDLDGLDGELMLKEGDFNNVQSAFMSSSGKPDFYFNVFDCYTDSHLPFLSREKQAAEIVERCGSDRVRLVPQLVIESEDELQEHYSRWLAQGYEGAIVRQPASPYKFGRSTPKQQWMSKLKVFNDDEALVIGMDELMHNHNEAELDNLGYQKRSHALAGQEGGDMMGALVVSWQGKQFKIGTGFDHEQRRRMWRNKEEYIGKQVTFKYQELSKYGIPRFPVFKGVRIERTKSTNKDTEVAEG